MTKTRFFLPLCLLIACGGTSTADDEIVTTSEGGETTVEVIQDGEGTQEDTPSETMVAVMNPTEGNQVAGQVEFVQQDDGQVRVRVSLTGFEPNTRHGFHIHEVGDCSAPDGTSAGGHFNPGGHDHALPETEHRHAGDLGNVDADAEGNVDAEFTFGGFSLSGENAIGGRSVIVHANEDDGGQPTGNAGPRISCGVINAPAPG